VFFLIENRRVCIILLLGTYIMKQMASYTLSSIAFGITQGLAPLCTLPLMYTMAICSTGPNLTAPVYAPRYPELVEQQIKFVSVMDSAALNIDLARDMKSAELAVDDLRSKVTLRFWGTALMKLNLQSDKAFQTSI